MKLPSLPPEQDRGQIGNQAKELKLAKATVSMLKILARDMAHIVTIAGVLLLLSAGASLFLDKWVNVIFSSATGLALLANGIITAKKKSLQEE